MKLDGNKVTLRPIQLSDAPRYVKWLNNPEITRFLQTRKHLTLKKEREWIRKSTHSTTDKNFAIVAKDGKHIGSVSLSAINKDHNRAVFGIFIGEKKYWNAGLGTEAAKLILEYGFNKLKLHRVELGVLAFNSRAIKVYRRLGFKMEGVKREYIKINGKYYDDFHMAILRENWKKRI